MSPKPIILLVDDEVEILSVLALNFELSGYNCIIAGTTREAEALIKNEHIDLVICDLIMPVESGLEFFQRLRTQALSIPPFLFCSGVPEAPIKAPFPEGIVGFMQKPFPLSELFDKVATICPPVLT